MMSIDISINGITKDRIKISNITEGGPSNDRLNEYSVFLNGKNIKTTVNHWRDDGSIKLACKVLRSISQSRKDSE